MEQCYIKEYQPDGQCSLRSIHVMQVHTNKQTNKSSQEVNLRKRMEQCYKKQYQYLGSQGILYKAYAVCSYICQ